MTSRRAGASRQRQRGDDIAGRKVIKQDGKTYRQNWRDAWVADKTFFGNDKVERDFWGRPKIERDWLGRQKVEKDWLGRPGILPNGWQERAYAVLTAPSSRLDDLLVSMLRFSGGR